MSDPCSRRRWMQMTGIAGTTAVISAVPTTVRAAQQTPTVTRRVTLEKVQAATVFAESAGNMTVNVSEDKLAGTVIFDSLVAATSGWSKPVDAQTKVKAAKDKKPSAKSRKVEPSCAVGHLTVDWSNNIDDTLVGFTLDVRGAFQLPKDGSATLLLSFGGSTFSHQLTYDDAVSSGANQTEPGGNYSLRFFAPAPVVKTASNFSWKLTAVVTAQGGSKEGDSALVTIDSIDIEGAFKSFPPGALPQNAQTAAAPTSPGT